MPLDNYCPTCGQPLERMERIQSYGRTMYREEVKPKRRRPQKPKKKRTLSKWQKFMKSPKSQIKIKRGKDKGKLNLKAMGKAYRKQERGKK